MPRISVIIPTYNRAAILRKCLNALSEQDYPGEEFEIIVVDDGSDDDTPGVVENFTQKNVRYYRQENKGPSAARNLGIRESAGEILLIIGDDIIAHRGLLKEHQKFHDRYEHLKTCVQGKIVWSDELEITNFMKWYDGTQYQFRFHEITGKTEITKEYLYTSNISVKREFICGNNLFLDEGFRPKACWPPSVATGAWEDTEWAFRLERAGMALYYNPSALGYHYHKFNFDAFVRRCLTVGLYWSIYCEKTGQSMDVHRKRFLRTLSDLAVNDRTIHLLTPLGRYFDAQNLSFPLIWRLIGNYYIRKGSRLSKAC